ncbi:hypothetical protein OPT61_g1734 [Boeremia exigua]|uniref:Uncharacterized protein n=1 Tax=Boeremia exigua TaxID=749465 RepID=A0ACC2IP43_9PLEO|nr:hypothetical protein OPT61_g1734 [Boeremia exigua]
MTVYSLGDVLQGRDVASIHLKSCLLSSTAQGTQYPTVIEDCTDTLQALVLAYSSFLRKFVAARNLAAMSWERLPKHLKLEILRHHLTTTTTEAIDHSTHLSNLVSGDLETMISTWSTELVQLSLEAYYSNNIFIVKAKTTYKGFSQAITFRPQKKHESMMRRLIDEIITPSMSRIDSAVGLCESVRSEISDPQTHSTLLEPAAVHQDSAPDDNTPSYGWYWELHSAKLNRMAKNKEVAQLALDAYYKSNVFVLAPHTIRTHFGSRPRLLRPRAQQSRKIKRLIFRMSTCFPLQWRAKAPSPTARIFFHQDHPWTFLFTPPEPKKYDNRFTNYISDDVITQRTAWQRNFTSLKEFMLDIRIRPKYASDKPISLSFIMGPVIPWLDICECNRLEDTLGVLGCGAMGVKAKSVTVKVSVEACQSGHCDKRITELLQGICSDSAAQLGAV